MGVTVRRVARTSTLLLSALPGAALGSEAGSDAAELSARLGVLR
jgi:hypothetical protein